MVFRTLYVLLILECYDFIDDEFRFLNSLLLTVGKGSVEKLKLKYCLCK